MVWCLPGVARAASETEVRSRIQQVFQLLQARNYSALYDSLPAATRSRMTRARFISALGRAQDRYVLDRISIGAVRVSGNVAVAETELFGRLAKPLAAEGKIVVQQYLVREDGALRVATGDTATIQQFLKANPTFGRKFPIRSPRIYIKQGNGWTELNPRQFQRR
jgi:hypothetical protein